MHRAAISLLLGTLLLASGCLSGPPGTTASPSPTATDTPGGHTATTPESWGTPPFPDWHPPEPPFVNRTIGNATPTDPEPHTYTVWNHDDEAKRIGLTVRQNGTGVLDRIYRFPDRGTLRLVLHSRANYRITITVPGANTSRTMIDRAEDFDCNSVGVNVAVLEGGSIRSQRFSTLLACDVPTES